MLDIVRDSIFGRALNAISSDRIFPYPESRPDFNIPTQFLPSTSNTPVPHERDARNQNLAVSETTTISPSVHSGSEEDGSVSQEKMRAMERALTERKEKEILVDWYDENDQENPFNWSLRKKVIVTAQIQLLTFAVYAGSSIYTPSIPGLMEAYNVNITTATAGLSLFIFGYSFGPLLFSPIQELPKLGRNPGYIVTLFAFMLFAMGTALSQNIESVLVTRFFAGFFGSPALATGGASIADIWGNKPLVVPYMIGIWAIGAVLGPVLSPFIGGYAAMANGWRWPNWILMWLAAFTLLTLTLFFPETQAANILHRRANRLRRLTGRKDIRTEGEKEQDALTVKELVVRSLWRPIGITLEPAPLFLGVYLGFAYALFYLFFESFPIVFGEMYGFNLGEQGLAFLGYFVTAVITYTGYALYLKYRIEPLALSGKMTPEDRLEIGLFASAIIPIATFFFGWSAGRTHWIVPIIAASLYLPGLYLIFQSLLVYIGMSYMQFAASAFAGNTLARSVIAGAFPLFGASLYTRLGIGPGSSLLGGISLLMIIPLYLIKRYGRILRSKSKYAPFSLDDETDEKKAEDVEHGRPAVNTNDIITAH